MKDNPHYLGEGPINFPAVIDALGDIGFDKWAELETEYAVQGRESGHDAEPGVPQGADQDAIVTIATARPREAADAECGAEILPRALAPARQRDCERLQDVNTNRAS